jgi:hypothetical protein
MQGLDKSAHAVRLGGSVGVAIQGRSNHDKGIHTDRMEDRMEGDAEQAAITKCGGTPTANAQTEASCHGCCGHPLVFIGLLFFAGRSRKMACSTVAPPLSCRPHHP